MEPNQTVKKTVAIPETITINGTSFSVKDNPEIQEFI